MPITLPVPGGGGATSPSTYYNGSNLGEYQFISIKEIIHNFQAAFVGEGKILENVLSGDVYFHAYRALQELHYDTVRSCKSQEIEVCSSLKMPLPHDYINYVKLAFIDNNGIEHVLYPASKTSNPFAIQQKADCSYEFEEGDLMHQKTCNITSVSCSAKDILTLGGLQDLYASGPIPENTAKSLLEDFKSKVDDYCNCTSVVYPNYKDNPCGVINKDGWDMFDAVAGGAVAPNLYFSDKNLERLKAILEAMQENRGETDLRGGVETRRSSLDLQPIERAISRVREMDQDDENSIREYMKLSQQILVGLLELTKSGGHPALEKVSGWSNAWKSFVNGWPEDVTMESGDCNTDSNSWNSYKNGGVGTGSVSINSATTVNASTDSDIYASNLGGRYGIDPQYAQGNGSYYIDCIRGNIHFSSNLAGRTIVLKYISDGVGKDDDSIVHKFAEEAMYKHIAYGCLSARVDSPEYLIARFKKERFAETRKAKIRLSNIKIEEISQVFRGKSKWIKH